MDYEIFVLIQSEQQYHKMWSFLLQEYKTFDKLFGRPIKSVLTLDLATARNRKKAIGFRYKNNIDCGEREYIHSLCRWIALRVGRKGVYQPFSSFLPYYICRKETLYIIPRKIAASNKTSKIATTTQTGMRNPIELPVFYKKEEQQKWVEVISEELERLTKEWKKYENTSDQLCETSTLRS